MAKMAVVSAASVVRIIIIVVVVVVSGAGLIEGGGCQVAEQSTKHVQPSSNVCEYQEAQQ
jgi:hypothetical protein